MSTVSTPEEQRLPGVVLAPGVAFGYAHVADPVQSDRAPRRIDPATREAELARLAAAIESVRQDLTDHVREFHSPAEEDLQQILRAHSLILEDTKFFRTVEERISTDCLSASEAIRDAFDAAAARLTAGPDPYMRARAEDLRDICQNLRGTLLRGPEGRRPPEAHRDQTVFLSANLYPTTVLRARRLGAVGFVTTCEARTSHGAILLRASGIPAVGGVTLPSIGLDDGIPVLVDGNRGAVVLRPARESIEQAIAHAREAELHAASGSTRPLNARSPDGREVALWANIDHTSQTELCRRYRLRGIGLFRTEFLAMETGRMPDEEEQYRAYRGVVEGLADRPLVLRTFDFGADKVLAGLDECIGSNPALGLRGLRRQLRRAPEELRTQLRAALRAAAGAEVSLLLPMVTHVDEVREARAHLAEVIDELDREGVPFNRDTRLGAMVEVPAAALGIAELLAHVDFVSIGTNDLIQYLAAADRDNEAVFQYLTPKTSGLFHLLDYVMERARRLDRAQDVSVCGDLASDPAGAAALVRAGVRSLSILPWTAPAVRRTIENAVAVDRNSAPKG